MRALTSKTLETLLLGSAAGLLAIAVATSAYAQEDDDDDDYGGRPVQYVKICSLYGAGFYYIPGTDMCLKIGGWVRAEYSYGYNGNLSLGPFNGNVNNNSTNNSTFRARGYLTADARNQTEYGTLRSYIAVGVNSNDIGLNTAANQFSANRAFIQFAGFTFGQATSFFDFYSVGGNQYGFVGAGSDTGDTGWMTFAYTAQFGSGVSASVAAEQRRMTQLINANPGEVGFPGGGGMDPGFLPGTTGTNVPITTNGGAYGGFNVPDMVGNLRINQAWGYAGVSGALHQVNALPYGVGPGTGHPSDTWGWAVGAGVKINTPWSGPGDYVESQITYTQGATRYSNMTPYVFNYGYVSGTTEAYGVNSDAVYGGTIPGGTATGLELTTAWSLNAAYTHSWNPQWKSTLWGSFLAVNYNDRANAMLCAAQGNGVGIGSAALAAPGCNNDWSLWGAGLRTWYADRNFAAGIEVSYAKMSTASPNLTGSLVGNPVAIGGATSASDQDVWMAIVRWQRNFYP